MSKIIIGVMGVGEQALTIDIQTAYQMGKLIAEAGWILLTGGRNCGVMDAASKGAKSAQGLTIGILPGNNKNHISEAVDIAIITDMGNARNNINVLSSDVIIACGIGAGTVSEISLALKANKKVILLNSHPKSQLFFRSLSKDNIFIANSPSVAINMVKNILGDRIVV